MHITEVAQDTYLINPALDLEFSLDEIAYLLTDTPPVLIEPGSTTTASRLLSRSREFGCNLSDLAYVIPTHIHIDHGGGSGFLARNFPQVQVVLHPRGAAHMVEPATLIQSTRLVLGDNFEEVFGPILPVPDSQIRIASDGEVIHLNNRDLTLLFAPGHASHHIAIWDSPTRGLFCGEALGIIRNDMPGHPLPAAVPPFKLASYLETIAKLANLDPTLLFYSHCGVGRDPQKLIQGLRENTVAFGQIVKKALEFGESNEMIWERLKDHVKARYPKAELPDQYRLTVSGYLSYFGSR